MKWGAPLAKAPRVEEDPWTTNERIWTEWYAYATGRGADNTQRNLTLYPRVFFDAFEDLVTELQPADIQNFVDRIATKCSKLQFGGRPTCLLGEDIAACPVVLGITPYSRCRKYRPLEPYGIWSYITSIHRMYSWLQQEGRIGRNPATKVMKEFAAENAGFFEERDRKPRRRSLETQEVRRIVAGTPLRFGIAIALMAKCFLREHEALFKLSWDPNYCDLDEGWMDLVRGPTEDGKRRPGKRLGNHRIIIDAELQPWMRRWRQQWEETVRRKPDGTPVTQNVVITRPGSPWGRGAIGNFNTQLHKHCERLGLMTGQETEREERVNTHCFRAYATTEASNKGCPEGDLLVMRGDLQAGQITRYRDVEKRLPDLYRLYAPNLGI